MTITHYKTFQDIPLVDIFDNVVDGLYNRRELKELADAMYADKRGGYLSDLFSNEEFMTSLADQLEHGPRQVKQHTKAYYNTRSVVRGLVWTAITLAATGWVIAGIWALWAVMG